MEECEERLADLLDQDDFDLDDAVTLTAGARKRTADFLQSLSPRQTGAFVVAGDDVPEPFERLREALDVAAKTDDADWKEITGVRSSRTSAGRSAASMRNAAGSSKTR